MSAGREAGLFPSERNVPGLGFGRDGCRTPMQWEPMPTAGFSSAAPWLPLDRSYPARNVANQREDQTSIYNLIEI